MRPDAPDISPRVLDRSEPVLESYAAAPGAKAAVIAGQALKDRPWFSIRMQLYISFGVLIAVVVGIGWATLTSPIGVQTYLLAGLLTYVVCMAWLLNLRIVGPFSRFYDYAKRIAAGDITPITPARRYSDEFSILAYLLNRMLTELDRSQRATAQSQKLRAVGTLSASVAHEINNPINNIMLSAYALLEDHEDASTEERKELIEDIVQEATRTRDIIRHMLDFTRRAEDEVDYVDLQAICADATELARKRLEEKSIRVEAEESEQVHLVPGDKLQLTQVVLNLLLNAADASTPGSTIEIVVEAHLDGSHVKLAVRDHGTGIPDHVFPLIFDPFFTTKPKGKGTGLGLAISKEIVQRHGGELTLETVRKKGTTATLTFPVAEIPADLRREHDNDQPESPWGCRPATT